MWRCHLGFGIPSTSMYKSVSQQTPFSLAGLALNTLKFNDSCPSVPSKRFLTWSGEGEVVLLSHIMFFLEMMPILLTAGELRQPCKSFQVYWKWNSKLAVNRALCGNHHGLSIIRLQFATNPLSPATTFSCAARLQKMQCRPCWAPVCGDQIRSPDWYPALKMSAPHGRHIKHRELAKTLRSQGCP